MAMDYFLLFINISCLYVQREGYFDSLLPFLYIFVSFKKDNIVRYIPALILFFFQKYHSFCFYFLTSVITNIHYQNVILYTRIQVYRIITTVEIIKTELRATSSPYHIKFFAKIFFILRDFRNIQ